MRPKLVVAWKHEDEDGNEIKDELPGRREVCGTCNGEGRHVDPAIDGHGISAEEWANDWDEDEREAYRNGAYDVTCEECGGEKIVTILDEDRAEIECPELLKAYLEYQEDCRRDAAERAAERRMGA